MKNWKKIIENEKEYTFVSNIKRKIKIKHICGYEYETDGYSFIKGYGRCKKCNNSIEKRKQTNLKRYNREFGFHKSKIHITKKTTNRIKNLTQKDGYEIIEINENKKRMVLKHLECGNIYDVSIYSFLKGRRCPKCKLKRTKKTWNDKNQKEIDDILSKIKKTNLNKHGVEWGFEKIDRKKIKEKYGVDHYSKTKEFKDKIKKTWNSKSQKQKNDILEKRKQTNLKRYGSSNVMKNEKIKKKVMNKKQDMLNKMKRTNMKKYGVEFTMQNKNVLKKQYITKRKNHTLNTSQIEIEFYNKILQQYPTVKREYKDDRYPFSCDFYIPELDLFIELNIHWTHGNEPFDKNNHAHQIILNEWKEKSKTSKFYEKAVYVWSVYDPIKIKYLNKNNINHILLYDNNEINNFLENIGDINVR